MKNEIYQSYGVVVRCLDPHPFDDWFVGTVIKEAGFPVFVHERDRSPLMKYRFLKKNFVIASNFENETESLEALGE